MPRNGVYAYEKFVRDEVVAELTLDGEEYWRSNVRASLCGLTAGAYMCKIGEELVALPPPWSCGDRLT